MIFKQGKNRMGAGRITKDVEVKSIATKNGDRSRAAIGVAVGSKDYPEYINGTAWGSLADYCGQLRKGDSVLVGGTEGEPREYNGKTYTDVQLDFIVLQPSVGQQTDRPVSQTLPSGEQMQEVDEDMPF